MRIALLSDIHANFNALQAVNADLATQGVAACWFLGDIVGYGPEPVACVHWLAEAIHGVDTEAWVLGNHDALLASLLYQHDMDMLTATPREAIELNRQALAADGSTDAFWQETFTDERALPRRHSIDGTDYTLVHARQTNGRYYQEYIYPWNDECLARELAALTERSAGQPQVQVYGHTHVPTLVHLIDGAPQATPVEPFATYSLDEVTLINPGSVGQPRDLDRRAAYAILDSARRTVTFRRVAYDWRQTARALAAGRYPSSLSLRLMNADPPTEATDEWLKQFAAARERAET